MLALMNIRHHQALQTRLSHNHNTRLNAISAVVSFALVFVQSIHAAAPRDAIESVLAKAKIVCEKVDKSNASAKNEAQTFANLLREIDTSACPADFREAFLDFIQANEAFVPYHAKYEGITGWVISVTEFVLTFEDKSGNAGQKLIDAVYAAEAKLQKVSLRYGVQMQPLITNEPPERHIFWYK
jgi:hypothetical protein